jgi:hypothetical protein
MYEYGTLKPIEGKGIGQKMEGMKQNQGIIFGNVTMKLPA